MPKTSLIAIVMPTSEDMIQVKKLADGYLYSYLSRGVVEFSNHVDTFDIIEKSIQRRYYEDSEYLISRLKWQLGLE